FRGEIQRFAPTFHDQPAFFRVERNDDALPSYGIPNFSKKIAADSGFIECGRSDNHAMRAFTDECPGPSGVTHTPTPARDGAGCEQFPQRVVRAAAHGGIEIDHLNLGESRETLKHVEWIVCFERLFSTLNELDDFTVHEVDARNDQSDVLI